MDTIWGVVGALMLISAKSMCETIDVGTEFTRIPKDDLPYDVVEFQEENYNEHVNFYLFTKFNVNDSQSIQINNVSSLIDSNFDASKETLLVVHGYRNNMKSPIFLDLKNGALEFLDVNLIWVDWDYFTRNLNYPWVVSNTKGVGIFVGQFLEFLMQQGLSETKLHLIGHSLGAHVAGFAGKELQTMGRKAARITGLDPALPGFTGDSTSRIDATDASYVDCIHTCGLLLGIPSPICQADFYPNRGQNVQPGCSILDLGICSHGRSFKYFAESFNPSRLFKAESCDGMGSFWVPKNCQDKGALMGYPAAAGGFRGLFSLTTNSRPPFAKNIIER